MPYPDYDEILEQRARRRKQEVEGGRQRVLKDMATGLVERLCGDYKIDFGSVVLHFTDPDWRDWEVELDVNGVKFKEKFHEFPSDVLGTTLMLLGKK